MLGDNATIGTSDANAVRRTLEERDGANNGPWHVTVDGLPCTAVNHINEVDATTQTEAHTYACCLSSPLRQGILHRRPLTNCRRRLIGLAKVTRRRKPLQPREAKSIAWWTKKFGLWKRTAMITTQRLASPEPPDAPRNLLHSFKIQFTFQHSKRKLAFVSAPSQVNVLFSVNSKLFYVREHVTFIRLNMSKFFHQYLSCSF